MRLKRSAPEPRLSRSMVAKPVLTLPKSQSTPAALVSAGLMARSHPPATPRNFDFDLRCPSVRFGHDSRAFVPLLVMMARIMQNLGVCRVAADSGSDILCKARKTSSVPVRRAGQIRTNLGRPLSRYRNMCPIHGFSAPADTNFM